MIKNCNIVGCAVNSTIVVNNPCDEDEERRERECKLDEAIRLRHEQILLENFYAGML